MRLTFWSPLPPDPSGVADYSYDLLAALAPLATVTAVVRDAYAGSMAPDGVEVISADQYRAQRFDRDIYQMGNHIGLHRYIYLQAMARPGLLVLHDPALLDFYAGLLGGANNEVFEEEARRNLGNDNPVPMVSTDRGLQPDRLAVLMTRRLVEASSCTLVHSTAIRDLMRERWPDARIEQVPLATPLPRHFRRPDGTAATFGIIGGISWHKGIEVGLEAFIAAHRLHPDIRLIVAGRSDEPDLAKRLARRIAAEGPDSPVECHLDVEITELQALIQATDALIARRWPTAGETSAMVLRAFAAGRIAITSDVPQNREFDSSYCRRVPVQWPDDPAALANCITEVAEDVAGVRRAGEAARRFVAENATPPLAAAAYLRHLDRLAAAPAKIAGGDEAPLAANAIASWASTTGLTEAARRATLALLDAGVTLAIEDYDFGSPRDPGRFPLRFDTLPTGRPYPIDLCFLNVNEFQVLPEHYLHEPGHYVIGSWFWELPSIPRAIAHQLQRVDEIWVASEFVKDAFAQYTTAHIEILPCVVEPVPTADFARGEFGIPDDRCVFLFAFDVNSTVARKNPQGVIAAFQQAFTAREREESVHLVVKTINLQSLVEARRLLEAEVAKVGGTLIDKEMTAGDVAALVESCDVFVSLHRAEGFGLGIAEAMYFGRPVIATAYSGNVDFTDATNSCGVGYFPRPIEGGEVRLNPSAEFIYVPGHLWAEPDIDQAARWMRLLYENPNTRRKIGDAGRDTVRGRFTSAAVGEAMRARLEVITAKLAEKPSGSVA